MTISFENLLSSFFTPVTLAIPIPLSLSIFEQSMRPLNPFVKKGIRQDEIEKGGTVARTIEMRFRRERVLRED